jgi:hypothetical protein
MKEKHAAVDPAMFDQNMASHDLPGRNQAKFSTNLRNSSFSKTLARKVEFKGYCGVPVSSEFRQSRSSKRNQEETKISTQGPVSHGRTSFDCWRSLTTKY